MEQEGKGLERERKDRDGRDRQKELEEGGSRTGGNWGEERRREEMVKRDRKCGAEGGKRGTKKMTRGQEGTKQRPPSSSPVSPMFPPMYPYVPTVSLQAAVMDMDPLSEGLYGRDPLRPPCVSVSPRPRDKVLPGVLKGHSVPVSCPVPPSGPPGGNPRLEVVLRQIHSLKKVRQAMAQELLKAQDRSEGLRQNLEQQSLWRAQLQGKDVEAKGQRHRRLCLEQQQDLEGTEQQWEQLRHLRRGHRWEYCQQLEAITEELKHMWDMHTPAHLEAELMHLEKMREKWLSWERCLTEAEEHLGAEVPVVMGLVRQEQEGAEQRLEVELSRRQLSLQSRDRLAEELQELQRPLEAPPE
ncbi:uncharacterized protein LOC125320772 isoform X2 [Corvus hawaiiensis]|uniref:uncharacterized protein LOC125320772 isoform X2 n=1 Tax=Corvus hawaiiensis TaxID=134902 RepID=UPI0020194EA2|nr:uncharacterized protein LOC125320772 isoform X2 [Corvus hawaiiensis]